MASDDDQAKAEAALRAFVVRIAGSVLLLAGAVLATFAKAARDKHYLMAAAAILVVGGVMVMPWGSWRRKSSGGL